MKRSIFPIALVASVLIFIFTGVLNAQLPSYLPTNGLVAWYPFNGNANDESGNSLNGTNSNATATSDRNGIQNRAFLFNGINSFITVSNSTLLNFQSANSFTLSYWLIPNFLSSTQESVIISKQTEAGASQDGFNSIIATTNSSRFRVMNGISTPNYTLGSPINSISINNWYHIVQCYDGINGRIYINGELAFTENGSAVIGDNTADLFIGKPGWTTSNVNLFNGKLDDIAIYNRALIPSEVTALYTATPTNTGGGTTSTNSAPPGIPYQAEVRNENGEVLANANVNVRFTLHELTANGTVSYQETQAITTNELGLFAATIGGGTTTQGTFAGINWSQTTKFLQVEVDAGNGFITMGNQQLMSVPYALYAANGPAGPQGPVGPQGPAGEQGAQGAAGTNGAEGVGIASVTTSGSNLVITLTNGQIQTVPFPTAPSSTTGSNANTLIYTVNGF